jgi:hypothetical protein
MNRSLMSYSMASNKEVTTTGAQITSTVPLPATHTATRAALFTRELLCNIATYLRFQGILAAAGTCREWRAALLGDPKIRETLFLKPAKVRIVLADENYMREMEKTIPLNECHIVGSALPLLDGVFDMINFVMENVGYSAFAERTLRTPNSIRDMPASAFDNANNFWRDMFITQPPCSKVQISISTCQSAWYPCSKDTLHDINFRRARGIKLGDLYDILHSRLAGDYNKYSITLTVRDFIPQVFVQDKYSVGGRVKCEVYDGEVQRPAPPTA